MAKIDPLLERNKHFATTAAREGISIVAKYPVYVITCLDPRTDPSAFLELEHGTVAVGMMRAIKSALDPHGLFNPGKVAGRIQE